MGASGKKRKKGRLGELLKFLTGEDEKWITREDLGDIPHDTGGESA